MNEFVSKLDTKLNNSSCTQLSKIQPTSNFAFALIFSGNSIAVEGATKIAETLRQLKMLTSLNLNLQ